MGVVGRRRRVSVTVGVSALVLSSVLLGLAAVDSFGSALPVATTAAPARPHPAPHRQPAATATPTTAGSGGVATPTTAALPPQVSDPVPAARTVVATTDGAVPGYASPGASAPDTTVPGSWYGYPSILPVIGAQPGWVEVRLAQRPNGSTTWVHRSDVRLGKTPYFLVVNLTTMHLAVYEHGTEILDFPAGIGSPDDPTPAGDYFVAMTVPPPDPSYGPFVLATSDHSDTITDWQNSGDAIIGIHGPITAAADARIGTTGAAISYGCIRLHDADLAQLATIPPGTPLDVVAG